MKVVLVGKEYEADARLESVPGTRGGVVIINNVSREIQPLFIPVPEYRIYGGIKWEVGEEAHPKAGQWYIDTFRDVPCWQPSGFPMPGGDMYPILTPVEVV